jgi:SAM-dependent methyltransferase
MNFELLSEIRAFELERVRAVLPRRCRVLEIGAGAGWQAKALSEAGFDVSAIDISAGGYEEQRVWPVQDYDGLAIPFADDSFDVVFSSNVLEHIPDVESFQAEIHRVLRPGGRAVHVLPTGSWRAWTILTHYGYLLRVVVAAARQGSRSGDVEALLAKTRNMSLWEKLTRAAIPPRHGEVGTMLTEVYLFSRFRWRALFQSTGWVVEQIAPVGLFYTGYSLAGSALRMTGRQSLARVLGSSCLVYVLRRHE